MVLRTIKICVHTLLIFLIYSGKICPQESAPNLSINNRLDLVLNNYSKVNNVKVLSASINIGKNNVWKGTYGLSYPYGNINPLIF